MPLSITLTPFQLAPTENWTTAKLNQGFNPAISFTGSVATGDLASGAVTAAKVTPDAYAYAAASGTDTYTATFSPTFTAYANGLQVRVKFANANATTTPTLDANSLGARKIRFRGDVALRVGDIPANCILDLTYNTSLDGGSGGWEVQDNLESAVVVGASRNLVAKYATASTVDIDADEVVLKNTAGIPFLASSVNLTLDITASGANGLDTGTEASNTWYYLWVIYNPTTATTAGLFSTSATAPTMPSGYTFKAMIGVVRNIGTGDFRDFHQVGRRVFAGEAVDFDDLAGVTGLTSRSIADYVPPIATVVRGNIGRSTGSGGGIRIGGNANGIGYCYAVAAVAANEFNGFFHAVPYELAMQTAQTIYWVAYDTSSSYRHTITGYDF